MATDEVRFGYSAGDLYGIARYAVMTDRWRPAINHEERVDAAYCTIVELLLSSGDAPWPRELIYVGREASSEIVGQHLKHHGIDKRGATFGQQRVNFARYWLALGDDPAHDRTIDRVALAQIWPRLSDDQQRALLALAMWGDYARAADHLGLAYGTYCARVRKARLRFFRLWHEGEQPSSLWGRDRRCGRETSLTAMRVFARRQRSRGADG